jgi:TRAP-type C4-dicarboxylate transport system substrate-binding protein
VRVRFGCRSWLRQGLYCRAAPSTSSGLRGLRLRVYNDATKRLAELSATAVTIAAQDLGKAIETGQVDAMLTSSTTGVTARPGRR